MKTGVCIREKVDNKWGSYDIGDKRLSDQQVVGWLRQQCVTQNPESFYERLVMVLIGRAK